MEFHFPFIAFTPYRGLSAPVLRAISKTIPAWQRLASSPAARHGTSAAHSFNQVADLLADILRAGDGLGHFVTDNLELTPAKPIDG
jgi:hypothetical protein